MVKGSELLGILDGYRVGGEALLRLERGNRENGFGVSSRRKLEIGAILYFGRICGLEINLLELNFRGCFGYAKINLGWYVRKDNG